MKLQDVLLKAMAKKITWWEAAEIIGVTDRTMRRWRERLQEHGYSGLADRRKGKPSDKRVPLATAEKVLRLFQETYYDLNIRHFHEKLQRGARHRAELHLGAEGAARSGPGGRGASGAKHRRRRERRPLPGMLLHIDGSKHQWFGDERWYDLIVILDDATSEIYYAQLVEEESTRTVMAGLREVIEIQGLFCALYSDRGSHFFVTPKAGEKVDKHRLTQVGRALKELGVQMIPAYSPQARGRESSATSAPGRGGCRRNCGWRGSTVEEANAFLRRAVHRGVQREVHGGGSGERNSISADGASRPGLGVHGADRTGGEQGQHGGDRTPPPAADPAPAHRMQSDRN